MARAGLDQVEGLGEEARKQEAEGIWVEEKDHGEFSGEKGAAAALCLVVARKEDRGRSSRRMELGPVL
jgi:hypothetical protein